VIGFIQPYIFNDVDEISFDFVIFILLLLLLENERRQVPFILELPDDILSLVI
jgi:hypothetical protein